MKIPNSVKRWLKDHILEGTDMVGIYLYSPLDIIGQMTLIEAIHLDLIARADSDTDVIYYQLTDNGKAWLNDDPEPDTTADSAPDTTYFKRCEDAIAELDSIDMDYVRNDEVHQAISKAWGILRGTHDNLPSNIDSEAGGQRVAELDADYIELRNEAIEAIAALQKKGDFATDKEKAAARKWLNRFHNMHIYSFEPESCPNCEEGDRFVGYITDDGEFCSKCYDEKYPDTDSAPDTLDDFQILVDLAPTDDAQEWFSPIEVAEFVNKETEALRQRVADLEEARDFAANIIGDAQESIHHGNRISSDTLGQALAALDSTTKSD